MAIRSLVPAALVVAVAALLIGPGGVWRSDGAATTASTPTVSYGGNSAPAAAPAALELPIGGRLFTTTTIPPNGASNSVTGLAVDPAGGVVFAANEFAGTITEFNESTGQLINEVTVATFAAGSFPAGLALDTAHHRLLVSVSTSFAGIRTGGWLLVLAEYGLGTIANVSLASAPFPPFEPTYLAYDAPTDQVFVENDSWGYLAVVNLTTLAPPVYLTCPVVQCAYHGYGLIDVPKYHTLVVPTCAQQLWFVNTSNDSTRATVTGPPNSLMAWAAFDTATDALWVENYSFAGATGSFFRMNLTTLAIEATVPGAPPRGTDLRYEPTLDLLVATDLDGSEKISTFNATTASLVATYASGSGGVHSFLTLVVDPVTHTAIASGPGNGTTIAFRLPALSVAIVYPSFSSSQPAAAVDPRSGIYVVAGLNPTTIRATSGAGGGAQWTTSLPNGSDPVALAITPVGGHPVTLASSVFVADRGSAVVWKLNAVNGYVEGNTSLPNGASPCALAYDWNTSRLFVGATSPSEVSQLDPDSGSVVHTLPLPGASPCGLAVDPTTGDLLALSTGVAGELFQIDPSPFTLSASWSVGSNPIAIGINASGTAFLLENSGAEVALLNASTGVSLGDYAFPHGSVTSVALDDDDRFLFGAAETSGSVDVLDTNTGQLVGTLMLSSPADSLGFDPVAGVLVAPVATGQVWAASLVPVPSAPTGLVATAGNGTANFSWGPPSSNGTYPTDGYAVEARSTVFGAAGVRTNVTGTAFILSNLSDGEPYLVRVLAHSAAGWGTTGSTATVTPIGVPFPPTDLVLLATGPTTMAVRWAPPASDDGSNVTEYTVFMFPTGSTPNSSISAGPLLVLNVTGLLPETEYTVYVTATNAAGIGHRSLFANASTLANPAPSSSAPNWAGIAIVVAVAAVAIGGALAWRRRRTRRGGSAGVDHREGDAPPAGGSS